MTIRNLNQRSHLFLIIVLPFHETCRRPIFTNARAKISPVTHPTNSLPDPNRPGYVNRASIF